VWIRPTTDRPNAINQLHDEMRQLFAQCDDLDLKSEHGYTPHMTVAQIKGKGRNDGARRLAQQFQEAWRPIEFSVSSICLLARSGDTPFQVYYELPLGTELALNAFTPLVVREESSLAHAASYRFEYDANKRSGEWRAHHFVERRQLGSNKSASSNEEVVPDEPTLPLDFTILTYNVLFDNAGDEVKNGVPPVALHSDVRLQCMLECLERSPAHIVCLQEVTPVVLAALLSCDFVRRSHWVTASSTEAASVTPYGQITLSRAPFATSTLTFSEHKRAVITTFAATAQRNAISAINVHLISSVSSTGSVRRHKQLAVLHEHCKQRHDAGVHVLVIGDSKSGLVTKPATTEILFFSS
jgi:hypothetical protein